MIIVLLLCVLQLLCLASGLHLVHTQDKVLVAMGDGGQTGEGGPTKADYTAAIPMLPLGGPCANDAAGHLCSLFKDQDGTPGLYSSVCHSFQAAVKKMGMEKLESASKGSYFGKIAGGVASTFMSTLDAGVLEMCMAELKQIKEELSKSLDTSTTMPLPMSTSSLITMGFVFQSMAEKGAPPQSTGEQSTAPANINSPSTPEQAGVAQVQTANEPVANVNSETNLPVNTNSQVTAQETVPAQVGNQVTAQQTVPAQAGQAASVQAVQQAAPVQVVNQPGVSTGVQGQTTGTPIQTGVVNSNPQSQSTANLPVVNSAPQTQSQGIGVEGK